MVVMCSTYFNLKTVWSQINSLTAAHQNLKYEVKYEA